jgi:hypothetical protein
MNKSKKPVWVIFFGALAIGAIAWLTIIKEPALEVSQDPSFRELDLHSPEVHERPQTPEDGVEFDAQEPLSDKPHNTTQKMPKPFEQQINDEALIAEIEQDMGFSPRPEGDLSYISPENETVQSEFVNFPVMEPEDPNATLGEDVNGPVMIGTPYEDDGS